MLRASTDPFGRALLLLEDGGPVLAAGEAVLRACAEALGAASAEPAAVLRALGERDAGAVAAVNALQSAGVACDFDVDGPGGRLRCSGRAEGALALLTLSVEPQGAAGPRNLAASLARQAEGQALILDAAADAVALFDTERRLAYANPAFARLWGLEPAWLADRPSHGALLDRLRQDRRLPEAADYALFKARELARHERVDAPPEALWRVAGERTLRVQSLPHPSGGLIMMFSDITPELRLNSQFNHLIQVQQATLDKLTDAVAVFGADGRLKLHNEAFQILWSIPPQVLSARPPYDEIVDHCVARLHDLAFWRETKGRITDLDPGVRAAASGEAQTADGRRMAWQSRPLPDGATLLSFVDVTDARRLETALRDREAALDAAEQLKRDFVGSVSHELRTPLTTILGYAELLEGAGGGLGPRARGWLASVRAAAGDLARSVDDILAFTEIDAGELTLDLGETDLADLLSGAASRWRGRAAGGEVALETRLEGELGVIVADGRRLASVVDHLVEHALRQTPARRPGRPVGATGVRRGMP